jgi:hypothetical protein
MVATIPQKFNIVRYHQNLIMKWRWNGTMLNLCGIVAAILKMATSRNFSMSGINSGHHYLPTYQILMISDNVEFLRYRSSFVKGLPQYRTNSTLFDFNVLNWFLTSKNFYRSPFPKWPPVEIGQCWICAVLWGPFWKWRPVEIFQCRESIRDIFIYQLIKFWWYSPFSKWPPQYCKNSTLSDII